MRTLPLHVCSFLLLCAASAHAENPAFTVSNISLQSSEHVYETQDSPQGPFCGKLIDLPKDNLVLRLTFSIDAKFDDTHTVVTLKPDDIQWDGLPDPAVFLGTWKSLGEFSRDNAITLNRPADWATRTDKKLSVTFLYAAPRSALGKTPALTIAAKKYTPLIQSSVSNGMYYNNIVKSPYASNFVLFADSLPAADPAKPAVVPPSSKLVIYRAELSFLCGNDALDPQLPFKAAYRDLNALCIKKDKTAFVAPLLGFVDAQGGFVALDPAQMIEGPATAAKPLVRAHKFVFAIPDDTQTVQLRLHNATLVSDTPRQGFTLVKAEAVIDEVITETHVRKSTEPYLAGKLLPAPAGKKYVRVTAFVKPSLPETAKSADVSFDANFIHCYAGQTPLEQLGGWGPYAIFNPPGGAGASTHGDSDRKTPLTINKVFLVPADTPQLTFELYYQKLTIPMPTATEKVDGTKSFGFTIKSAKLVDAAAECKNPNGKVLLLNVEWHDNGRNDTDNGTPYLNFGHKWLNLTWGNDGIAPCVSDWDGKALFSYHADGSSVGTFTQGTPIPDFKHTDTFVFLVPADLTTFNLTYNGWPVATGTASK